jgi:hypothetical protein
MQKKFRTERLSPFVNTLIVILVSGIISKFWKFGDCVVFCDLGTEVVVVDCGVQGNQEEGERKIKPTEPAYSC